jgi:hypothetical protein
MIRETGKASRLRGLMRGAAVLALALAGSLCSRAADAPQIQKDQVQLDVSKAGPRAVESLTQHGILRDYGSAWTSLAHALEFNTLDPLDGPFVGTAKKWLTERVLGQQRSGLRSRYQDQSHKLQAIFYAPEGDVIELHDTAEYRLQVLDGAKAVHDERVVVHYVVLMTPGADRWVIRQLQAVSQF